MSTRRATNKQNAMAREATIGRRQQQLPSQKPVSAPLQGASAGRGSAPLPSQAIPVRRGSASTLPQAIPVRRGSASTLPPSQSTYQLHTAASLARLQPTEGEEKEEEIKSTRVQSSNNIENSSITHQLRNQATLHTKIIRKYVNKYYTINPSLIYNNEALITSINSPNPTSELLNNLYIKIIDQENFQFYFKNIVKINSYLINLINSTIVLKLSLGEKKNKLNKIYNILKYSLTKLTEYSTHHRTTKEQQIKSRIDFVNETTSAINGIIDLIPQEYRLIPYNNRNIYDNLNYLKELENQSKNFTGKIINKTGNIYYLVDVNTTSLIEREVINISKYGFTLKYNYDWESLIIMDKINRDDSYKLKYRTFDTTSCKISDPAKETIENITVTKVNPSKTSLSNFDNITIPMSILDKHIHAVVLNRICRYVDAKIGKIIEESQKQSDINYESSKNYIRFLYNNLNTYLPLPNESYIENYNILLHFYIALFLHKQLIDRNHLVDGLINDIQAERPNLQNLKYIIHICKRLLKYRSFNVIVQNINVSEKMYNYIINILRLIYGYICSHDFNVDKKRQIDILLGFNICEGELYLDITKKILNINLSYNDFKTYIDNIDTRRNIKNKFILYRKVINELIFYYFHNTIHNNEFQIPSDFVLLDHLLKINDEYKYTPTRDSTSRTVLRYKTHLWYNYSLAGRSESGTRIPEIKSSLNRYNITTKSIQEPRNIRTQLRNQPAINFLNEIFSNPNPINEVINNKMINDTILAKILYFYFIFNKELNKVKTECQTEIAILSGIKITNRSAQQTSRLTYLQQFIDNKLKLNDEEKYFFIDILEYQFYLYHIIRKKVEHDNNTIWTPQTKPQTLPADISEINYNYFKAATILQALSPITYDVLHSYYNLHLTNLQNIIQKGVTMSYINFMENIDRELKSLNVGKVIQYIHIQPPFDITNLLAHINGFVQNPFMTCYNNLVRSATRGSINRHNNFVNFAFLENYINNPANIHNIHCLLNPENINTYQMLPIQSESNENKKNKLTNLVKLIPHIIFYYYNYIINTVNHNMVQFLNNEDNKVLIYNFLQFIEHVLDFYLEFLVVGITNEEHSYIKLPNPRRPEPLNMGNLLAINNTLYKIIYKINKVIYKCLNDLYQKLNENTLGNQDFIERVRYYYDRINTQRGIISLWFNDITRNNYIKSSIPDYSRLNKEAARRFIRKENNIVRMAIHYLSNKPEAVPDNLQGKFTNKYNSFYRNLNVKNLNMKTYSHNINAKTNISLFRKKFNNEKLGITHPINRYLYSYQQRII